MDSTAGKHGWRIGNPVSNMDTRKIKERRRKLFEEQEGKCYYCGNLMILAEVVNGGPPIAPNMVTLEHFDDRYSELRGTFQEPRTAAVCWQCNNDSNKIRQFMLPVEDLKKQQAKETIFDPIGTIGSMPCEIYLGRLLNDPDGSKYKITKSLLRLFNITKKRLKELQKLPSGDAEYFRNLMMKEVRLRLEEITGHKLGKRGSYDPCTDKITTVAFCCLKTYFKTYRE